MNGTHSIGYLLPYAAVVLGLQILHNAWIAILLYHLGIIAILTLSRGRNYLSQVKKGYNRNWLLAGTLFFALTAPCLLLLFPWVTNPEQLAGFLSGVGLSGTTWTVFLIWSIFANPILEELYWRGLLLDPNPAPSIADLFFAGYHLLVIYHFLAWPWLLPALLALSAASWLWRTITRRLGGLFVPIITHAVADLAIILAVWSFSSRLE